MGRNVEIFLKENNEQGLVSFAGRRSLEVSHFLPKPHASVGPEGYWSVEIAISSFAKQAMVKAKAVIGVKGSKTY